MNKNLKAIPKFRSEAEERRFWDTHDSERLRRLEQGGARAASKPQAVDDLYFPAPAGDTS